jgi:hypothetical protein
MFLGQQHFIKSRPDFPFATDVRQSHSPGSEYSQGAHSIGRTGIGDAILTQVKPLSPVVAPDAGCRRLVFQERQREAQQARAAAMKPYHQFRAMLRFRQTFEESLTHLTSCKALPDIATPPIDDPWS